MIPDKIQDGGWPADILKQFVSQYLGNGQHTDCDIS